MTIDANKINHVKQHQMSEWPFLLCLHFFLLFFHPHTSHQVTINASTQALTFVHDIRQKKRIIQIFSSLGRMSLCFLQPIFLLPSACSTLLISSLVKRHGWHEDFGDKLIRVCFGYHSLILLKTETENNKKNHFQVTVHVENIVHLP